MTTDYNNFIIYPNYDQVCPTCRHCPTCGHKNFPVQPFVLPHPRYIYKYETTSSPNLDSSTTANACK